MLVFQTGQLNAYVLNLVSVVFLQSQNLIPAMHRGCDSRVIDGWQVDFRVEPFHFSSIDMQQLFKVSLHAIRTV